MGMFDILLGVLVFAFVALQWIGLQHTTNDVINSTKDIFYNGTNTSLPSDYNEQFDIASNSLYLYPLFLGIIIFIWAVKKTGEEKTPYG